MRDREAMPQLPAAPRRNPLVLLPKGTPTGGVLIIPSWWGLTSSFHHWAGRLTKAGFAVALADLFDGKLARTVEEAKALRAGPRRTPLYKMLLADLDALAEAIGPGAAHGVVGFSMGGHWAVWLAQHAPHKIAAVVLFYAARGGSFGTCRASFQCHFAEFDPWVPPSARRNMERRILAAGLPLTTYEYKGTSHWFAEPSVPDAFNAEAAELAFDRALIHLRKACRRS